MGFSDTATYVRTGNPAAVQAELTPILARYGYEPSHRTRLEPVRSYTPLAETPSIQMWVEQASRTWLRLYSSHSGIFTFHDGDYVPVLQRLSAALKTDGFEIAVNDGDSICVLETHGTRSRLTGCHTYVLDEIYEDTGDLKLVPGAVHALRGIRFPYQNLSVDAQIIPELIGYDFGHDMQAAITDFEAAVFGRSLPGYFEFLCEDPEATRKGMFGYLRRASD